MSSSDPAIKLFGKTIIALPLPTQDDGGGGGHDDEGFPSEGTATSTSHEIIIMKEKGEDTRPASDEQGIDAPTTTPVDHEAPKRSHSSSDDEEEDDDEDDDDDQAGKGPKSSQGNNKHSDSSGSNAQEKPPLKKPDKILPCPRCNSMDTKFCYYNNYNVNQPRHFCKKCQRYWTAGGTMRNVPVGAGRRKNKNAAAAAHYRHLTITDAAALQAIATPDSAHHLALNPNGTVLSFGSDAPLRESMASVLNLAEKTIKKNCNRNGFHQTDEQMEERSTGSSTACLNSGDEGNGANLQQEPAIRNCQGFAPHVPCTNGASSPWPYPWGPPQPASPTAPPFCGSSFPIPIYPAAAGAYWGCTTWGMPWIAPMASTSPTSGFGSNNSPTLGKHSREGEVLHRGGESFKQSNQEEKNLWVPKTLRIDDPEDAAKSSIWATMGFSRDDKPGGVMSGRKGGGLFKTFQNSKTQPGCHDRAESNSQVLHANPAALSRCINFNESS